MERENEAKACYSDAVSSLGIFNVGTQAHKFGEYGPLNGVIVDPELGRNPEIICATHNS